MADEQLTLILQSIDRRLEKLEEKLDKKAEQAALEALDHRVSRLEEDATRAAGVEQASRTQDVRARQSWDRWIAAAGIAFWAVTAAWNIAVGVIHL